MRARIPHRNIKRVQPAKKRRGGVLVLATALIVGAFAFTAFTVDVGLIVLTKTQMQNAADAAALAAVSELPAGWGKGATLTAEQTASEAGESARLVAAANRLSDTPSVVLQAERDVRFGRRIWDGLAGDYSETWGVPPYNMVQVTVRRNVWTEDGVPSAGGDGPLNLFFAPVIGHSEANLSVSATAALAAGYGFHISTDSSHTVDILPITYDLGSWNALLSGIGQDKYSYDPDTGAVSVGSDGILEIDLYPTSRIDLPSGNRGTVDIGNPNNSTDDLDRQILNGLNAYDLSFFENATLAASMENPLYINGDTGISAQLKAPLTEIIGLPRAIPIFNSVSAPGNNATYTVVKFVGIRLMEVKLTGGNKYVIAQPAPFVDSSIVRSQTLEITEDSIFAPGSLTR